MRNKRAVRRRVGEPVGKSTAKKVSSNFEYDLSTRTLYDEPLLNLSKGTNIDDRLRDAVNFRGIKICMSLVNKTSTTNGQHLYFNYAIVSPKADGDKAIVTTTEFFRGAGTARGADFTTTLNALEFRCLPINTDKWNVHKHRRLSLAPYSSNEGRNTRTMEWYHKIGRQIRYDDAGAQTPIGKQLFLVYWCDYQDNNSGTVVQTNVADLQMRFVKYFREPRN